MLQIVSFTGKKIINPGGSTKYLSIPDNMESSS